MPVQVPSKVLESLLTTLFDSNQLNSWTIFNEKSGAVTVRLRFNGGHDGQPSMDLGHTGKASYKKKNEKQSQRDYSRAKKYKENKETRPVTRSMLAKGNADFSIEQPRSENSDSFALPNHSLISTCEPMSPELEHEDHDLHVKDSLVSDTNSVVVSTPRCSAPVDETVNIDQLCIISDTGHHLEQSVQNDSQDLSISSQEGNNIDFIGNPVPNRNSCVNFNDVLCDTESGNNPEPMSLDDEPKFPIEQVIQVLSCMLGESRLSPANDET